MGCCLVTAMCCCCQEACRCCCSLCPPCLKTTATRLAYLGFLIVGLIIACIFLAPAIGEGLLKFESFCNTSALYLPTQPVAGCAHASQAVKQVVGFPAVYRICFALAVFFFVLMVMMIGVKSSKDCRAGIQNGFWFFKGLIVIGIAIGAFFIHDPNFDLGLMIVGGIGAFVFYIIQMTLLVDFSYKWTASWVGRHEETENRLWFVGVILFAILFYAMFISLVVILYVFYANGDCKLHKFFISFNFIVCVILSAISVIPRIQKYNPRSGLLQSSVVSLYIMYVTWTAVNSSLSCNPLSTCSVSSNVTTQVNYENCIPTTFSYDVIVPLIVLLICIIYAGTSDGSTGAVDTVRGATQEEQAAHADDGVSEGKLGQDIIDDEEDSCRYNYSFFHFIFLVSVLFLMMTLTHWYTPNVKDVQTNPAVWVKICSSWVSMVIYLWVMIAPLVLRNRTFM